MFGFGKKDSLADVLSALLEFGGDARAFERLKSAALSFFGPSWQFSLEMYVLSLPAGERDKYLPQFRRAMRYAKASAIWLSAKRILSGDENFSPSEAGEYAECLPLFGDAGKRLLEELFARFGLKGQDIKASASQSAQSPVSPEPAKKPEPVELKSKSEPKVEPAPISKSKPLPVARQEQKEAAASISEQAPESEPEPVAEPTPVPAAKPATEPELVPEPAAKPKAKSADWKIAAFERVADFVESAREVMSAMVVEKGYASLEDYPGYVLLRDATEYAVSLGAKLKDAGVSRRMELLASALDGEITIEKSDETE
jgi:hypothetical protein